jgi:hypothetical protein
LGELADRIDLWPHALPTPRPPAPDAHPLLGFSGGLAYVKVGLAGCAGRADWSGAWSRLQSQLPRGARLVAVAYADWRAAQAPRPRDVLAAAAAAGCNTLLVDTFDKRAGDLLSAMPLDELCALVADARRHNCLVALAGSLQRETIPQVLALGPDYVAVRGAACLGGRDGRVCAERVRALVMLLRGDKPHVLCGRPHKNQ